MKDPFSSVDEQSICESLSIGRIATLACIFEVTAPKPGNVHRGADFEDVTFGDFLISAVAIGEVFDRPDLSIGQNVLQAVQQTQALVGTNTNLGIVLLLSPLVAAARASNKLGSKKLTSELVAECLSATTSADGRAIFEAIALAKPGGLGKSSMFDVNATQGEVDLLAAMKLAADRDSIAKQYTTGLADVFGIGQRLLAQGRALFEDLNSAIVFCHVAWMAHHPDSLIQRKSGLPVTQQAQRMAQKTIDVLQGKQSRLDEASVEQFWRSIAELDFWLRSDGHQRNPGTTADLIAATLFVAIYNGTLSFPFRCES
ncbi:triphosphoribosyl-dephospho-CoA synthase [Mariniblastus sp.]|nr:triphosphoribosyl-dephospho-CoA synthase [Mariniblastus sp.]